MQEWEYLNRAINTLNEYFNILEGASVIKSKWQEYQDYKQYNIMWS